MLHVLTMKEDDNTKTPPTLMQSAATGELIKLLSPSLEFVTIKPGRRLFYHVDGIRMCYFIRSGLSRVCRDKDEIVMSSLPAPNIAGFANESTSAKNSALFIEAISECEVASICTEDARKLVSDYNAWELMVEHLTKVSNILFTHYVMMTASSAYEIIRYHLIDLMSQPLEIRNSVSAVTYILQRTRLSKNSVMKVLAQLKKGGYIKLENGLLKSVNKLPLKY